MYAQIEKDFVSKTPLFVLLLKKFKCNFAELSFFTPEIKVSKLRVTTYSSKLSPNFLLATMNDFKVLKYHTECTKVP